MKYSELIEKKQHGTPSFPIEYYYIDSSHPRYIMASHWHKEFEIIRVLEGKLTVYLNKEKYDLTSGECLFVEGGCLKRGYPDSCVYECFVFDGAMLDRHKSDGSVEYKHFISTSERVIIKTIDSLICSVREEKPFYELEVVGLLYKLFYEMYSFGYIVKNKEQSKDRGVDTVMSIIKWIEKHAAELISLSRLSQVMGLSEKYICRIFKEYTSKTITEYVSEIRIERACAEMAEKSITEAAFACGFNDLSYFSKTFKKYKGMTPREYKKAYSVKNVVT